MCVCDAGNERPGMRIFGGGIREEDPGQFNKICFPQPPSSQPHAPSSHPSTFTHSLSLALSLPQENGKGDNRSVQQRTLAYSVYICMCPGDCQLGAYLKLGQVGRDGRRILITLCRTGLQTASPLSYESLFN